ncbi:LysM peptidoglycan-binding domain-containing protein [Pacificoceanicola onchidii]|uniref:LysM peptidoglycan-binding domain-containing protein n=1 Tax=Pacificoceanicola onchidii TaxID=2562685 RepID=UPI0010A52B31|nr:LysM peptidoglycan-binding domain-containing protein [Pacificoceanicola onchidii]
MIRMVLFAVGFIAITIALVVFQPGSNRTASTPDIPQPVTRAEPALDAAAPQDDPLARAISNGVGQAPQPAPRPTPRIAVAPSSDLDDQSLRRMTWDTLSNLNQATGHEKAPGQPGSLLHTIVRRSLDDTTAAPAAQEATAEGTYIVQPGDSLVSIAELIYGDVNMTGPLFAANQQQLARPDDLRPGQKLILPAN